MLAAAIPSQSYSGEAEAASVVRLAANLIGQIREDEAVLPLTTPLILQALSESELRPILVSIATKAIEPGYSYVPGQNLIRRNFERMLNHASGCDAKSSDFDIEAERGKLERILFMKSKSGAKRYSPRYLSHLSFERKISELEDEYERADTLSNRVQIAAKKANLENAWEAAGRHIFEDAVRRYEALLQASRGVYWAKAHDRFRQWALLNQDGDEIGQADIDAVLNPGGLGWSQITLKATEGSRFVDGIVDYKVQRFEHAWLDHRLLSEACWTWSSPATPFNNSYISNGTALVGDFDRAKGVFWAVPTGFVLTRGMNVSSGNGSSVFAEPTLFGVLVKRVQRLP